MTTDSESNRSYPVCHAPGDKCLGCDHYYGKADKCKYEEAMNTEDLKSMTVEERDALVYGPCEEDWKKTFPDGSRADAWCLFVEAWLLGYERQNRRLEEAQHQTVAQQARIEQLRGYACSCNRASDLLWLPCMVHDRPEMDDLSALAAHDAELTAKAKAEALEWAALAYPGNGEPIYGWLKEKAAEYRAKAGRKE